MPQGTGTHLKRLVLPIYVPMFLLSMGIAAPMAGFPQYLGSLGASLAVTGLIVSLTGIGHLLSDLPGGMILTRVRLRAVMVVCFIASAVAAVLIALTSNLVIVAILRLVAGATTTVIVTAIMTYVRLTVPAAQRGRALSLVGGSFRLGAFTGPFLGGLLMDRLGMPAAFIMQAGCFIVAVATVVVSPDRSVGASREDAKPGLRESARVVGKGMQGQWGATLTVGSAVVILTLLRATRSIALPLWGDSLSLSVTTIGAIISAGSVMDLLLFVPAGMIMDKAGRKVAASICIGVFSLGLLSLPLASGAAGLLIASLLIGLGNGFGAGINMTMGTDLAPREGASAFIGVWRLFGDVGATLGPVMMGAVATAAGLSAAIYITTGLGAVGVVIMALFAPETLHLARRKTGGDEV